MKRKNKLEHLEPEMSNINYIPTKVIDMAKESGNLDKPRNFAFNNKKKLKEKVGLSPIEERYFQKKDYSEKLEDWLSRILDYGPMTQNDISDVYTYYFLDKDKASKKDRKTLREELSRNLDKKILGYKDGKYYKSHLLRRIFKI